MGNGVKKEGKTFPEFPLFNFFILNNPVDKGVTKEEFFFMRTTQLGFRMEKRTNLHNYHIQQLDVRRGKGNQKEQQKKKIRVKELNRHINTLIESQIKHCSLQVYIVKIHILNKRTWRAKHLSYRKLGNINIPLLVSLNTNQKLYVSYSDLAMHHFPRSDNLQTMTGVLLV